ncbi:hypothetical protein PMIN04_009353 [Paraphaeosphaeria minitans]
MSHTGIKNRARLDSLPAEITRNILSCLKENTDLLYDDLSEINESDFQDRFALVSRNHRSASLVNRAVGPWGQDLLFHSSVLYPSHSLWWSMQHTHRLALFARTLLERRDLGAKVRQLTIFVPGRTRAGIMSWDAEEEEGTVTTVLKQAATYIESLPVPKKLSISWAKKLWKKYPYSLIGVILSLVSNVKNVTLVLDTEVTPDDGVELLCTCFGIRPASARNLGHLQRIGVLSSVESLTVRGPSPAAMAGLEHFPGIRDLHLRLEFRPIRRAGLKPGWLNSIPNVSNFRNVTKLRLDVQLVPMSFFASNTTPEEYFGPLLSTFESLKHLDLSDGPRDNDREYENMSAAHILQHFSNPFQLLSLKLPRKLAGSRMLTATMKGFVNLGRLTAPFCAIVNKDLDNFATLPESLQHLVLHDSIFDTVPCVMGLLQKKMAGETSTELRTIDLCFAASFTNNSLKLLREGEMFPNLGTKAAAAGVRLTLNKVVPDAEHE